jgi:hypothetical protein
MRGRIVRLGATVALLACAFASVLWISGPQTISAAMSQLVWPSVLLVALLLLGGVVLASLRLKLITADLGYRLTFRDAAMTLSAGQLAGTAFFQLAGQLIGRSAVLSRRGIPAAATVVISGYERVVAMSVSLLLAGCGAVYLFGTLSVDLKSGGASFLKLAIGFAAVTFAGAFFAWGRTVLDLARRITPELFFRLLRSFLISLAIQGTTLAAYIALEWALAPQIGIASLAAASCIVMLAASLPISFGGWGLRELSAVVALQAIGLSSASALLIALLIGFLSLAVIAGMAIVIMAGREPAPHPKATVSNVAAPDYTATLDWVLPAMAATAVFFQVYIPTGNGLISVNLADPVVVLGASLFVLHHFGKGWPVWRAPHTGAWIAAATAVIALGVFRGWMSFGWTDWAFVNKGLGWPILLCYGATGALIVRRAQQGGLDLLAATFAATGAAIVLLDVGLIALISVGVGDLRGLVSARVDGFSQNANAFALMLCLALAAAIMLNARPGLRIGLAAAALVGIWFSGSRAGLLAVPGILTAALAMGVALRPLLKAALIATAIVAAIGVLPLLTQAAGGGLLGNSLMLHQRTDVVELQHLQSVLDGLALFLAHPLFGAGIGAYMDGQIRDTGTPLVIHSTPVWLLAETGLIGFGVFLAAASRLFFDAIGRRGDPAALLLVLILCGLGVMSAVHEMLYQRAIWLLLGAVLAMPVAAARRDRRS